MFERVIVKKCKWKVMGENLCLIKYEETEKQQQKIWCENKEQIYTYYSKNTREKNRRAKCSQKFPKQEQVPAAKETDRFKISPEKPCG